MNIIQSFSVGDIVRWSSQSFGCPKTKTGEVIRVIPAGAPSGVKKSGRPRDHESYVVRVKGSGEMWPLVRYLQKGMA